MVETVRWSPIYAEDIDFGFGTKSVELQKGNFQTMSQLNITHLIEAPATHVLYSTTDGSSDSEFRYIIGDQRLFVHKVAGDDTASQVLQLEGSTHATLKGAVLINPSGGDVGIGLTNPQSSLHVANSGESLVTIENTSGSANDAGVVFRLAGTDKWHIGVDDSDSDKLKIGSGGSIGTGIIAISGTDVGIGEDAPGGKLHVKTSESGATFQTDADDLIVESSGNTGMTIAASDTGTSSWRASNSSVSAAGAVVYDHNADQWELTAGSTEVARFNQTSVEFDVVNLNMDQEASVGEVMSFAGDAVAHGLTGIDTNKYGTLERVSDTEGGLNITGATEVTQALQITGNYLTEDTTDTSSSTAPVEVVVTKNGSSTGNTGNLFAVRNLTTTDFLVKGNGDIHTSSGAAPVSLDDHDDMQLIRTLRAISVPSFRDRLGQHFTENLDVLKEAGVIFPNDDGSFMYSHRGMFGLIMDAMRQMAARVEYLEAQVGHQ